MSALAVSSLLFAAAFAFLGCASLALSQSRNWRAVTGATLLTSTQRTVRLTGWVLLIAALALCIARDGVGFAALTWPLLFAAGAFVVAMILSFRPRLLKPAARLYGSIGSQ